VRYMDEARAKQFAEIFAGNSMDGVYSHGMNRFPRYIRTIQSGMCDTSVLAIEKTGGFGALETWDAKDGIGPLMARQAAARAAELAKAHGIGCVALKNNSHWLRAGRYALEMAQKGLCAICFTNTCQNLAPWGSMTTAIGNNPIAMAIPRSEGPLLMDMAVSQYAFGKLEIMAQEGQMLDTECGYDLEGNLTNDPQKIVQSMLMLPMALWKGSALSIMIDLMASMLSLGRTSLEIGRPGDGEKGMSQMFICMNPAAVVDMDRAEEQMERSIEFLNALQLHGEKGGVHVPGQNLEKTRQRNCEHGIPVTEGTWQKILDAAK